jgi:hypothetical protein
MHRRAGVKMHHGRMGEAGRRGGALVHATSPQTQLSSSINEPASPSRPGITLSTVRSVGDGRSGATRSTARMASTVADWSPAGFYVWRWRCLLCLSR